MKKTTKNGPAAVAHHHFEKSAFFCAYISGSVDDFLGSTLTPQNRGAPCYSSILTFWKWWGWGVDSSDLGGSLLPSVVWLKYKIIITCVMNTILLQWSMVIIYKLGLFETWTIGFLWNLVCKFTDRMQQKLHFLDWWFQVSSPSVPSLALELQRKYGNHGNGLCARKCVELQISILF